MAHGHLYGDTTQNFHNFTWIQIAIGLHSLMFFPKLHVIKVGILLYFVLQQIN